MKVSDENYHILESFINDTLAELEKIEPLILALAADPDQEQLAVEVTRQGFRLFHRVTGAAGFLHLEHIEEPASAVEYLLDRVHSGILNLIPRYIALLAEVCQFLKKGLPIVLAQRSDIPLEISSSDLASAVTLSMIEPGLSRKGSEQHSESSPTMKEAFVWEAGSLLESAEQEFVLWDFVSVDYQRVSDLIGLLVRLKRNFAFFELGDLEHLCQAMAAILDRFLNGEFFQGEYPERIFLRIIDAVRESLGHFAVTGDGTVKSLSESLNHLQSLIRKPLGEILIEAGLVAGDTLQQALELQKKAKEKKIGQVLVEMGEVSPEQIKEILQERYTLPESKSQDEDAPTQKASTIAPDEQEPFQKVSVTWLRLMTELVERLVTESAGTGIDVELIAALQQQMQEISFVSLNTLAPKLKRQVQEYTTRFRKKVHFSMEGTGEQMDAGIVDALISPLLHLLKNGVQHGIEPVEIRKNNGKKLTGRLVLLVLARADEIWVSVEDDGCGLDLINICNMAVKAGLITDQQAITLTSKEIGRLIFDLGTIDIDQSLDQQASGTGMKAVQQSLHTLGGEVDVLTRQGKGTRVTLRIPRNQDVPDDYNNQ